MNKPVPEGYAEVYIYYPDKYSSRPRVYISGDKVFTFLRKGFVRVYVEYGEASLNVRWQNYGYGGAPNFDGLLTLEPNKQYFIKLTDTFDVEYEKRIINQGSEVKLVEKDQLSVL